MHSGRKQVDAQFPEWINNEMSMLPPEILRKDAYPRTGPEKEVCEPRIFEKACKDRHGPWARGACSWRFAFRRKVCVMRERPAQERRDSR